MIAAPAAAQNGKSSVDASERRALRGAPGLLLAFAGGGAAALAHPPFGIWPGIAGFALILHALDAAPARAPLRAGFARGWAAGFAYLLIGTWWVSEAFFVDPAEHGWQAPFAVLFTAGGIGLFWAGAGFVYRLLKLRGAVRIFAFAAVLSGFEWLRGHVLTGFPWDLPGECWRAGSAPSQGAAVFGAYGMTLMTVAIGAAPVVLFDAGGWRRKAAPLVLAAAALALLWGGGAARLADAREPDTALRLRVVQPGLNEQQEDLGLRITRFARLTAWPAARRPDVVIWPEGAIPAAFDDYLAPGTWTQAALIDALQPGQILMDGGTRVAGPPDHPRYYNTLLVLRREADGFQALAYYDKYRLVPFGEFLPFPAVFSLLHMTSLVQNGQPFTPGPPPAPIAPAGLPPVQPLICYESLFPGFTAGGARRPAWIVNVSDDAWFGRTSGPLQHLNLASYRAIEEGLPLVRATPTGVSAIVDGYGRIRARLGLGRSGIIDGLLPAALQPTLYSWWRDLPFYFGELVLLAFALVDQARSRFRVE